MSPCTRRPPDQPGVGTAAGQCRNQKGCTGRDDLGKVALFWLIVGSLSPKSWKSCPLSAQSA
eukprot:scaffold145942_cov18-Tisochrysis_lutea.AAC.2